MLEENGPKSEGEETNGTLGGSRMKRGYMQESELPTWYFMASMASMASSVAVDFYYHIAGYLEKMNVEILFPFHPPNIKFQHITLLIESWLQ
ncbi:hypothetical protein BDV33DRAFT_42062 [Aspergillus novoparasiticus]|uniref:Uncharacterized protein n=1 Tax=Aspergillus novoparasiticus TaxID=986946 RepID=A0A5N6EAK7_9EURO|nr:hypothetical protein BDV33DRAFT_42062 [Aspergillus novoparasiticus]